MTKTSKRTTKKNVTKKNNKFVTCQIGLKSFEEEFSKHMTKKQLMKTNDAKKKEIVKELLSKFAPNSIKPENNFYDYINYQWAKNVSLEQQQKYLTQIDDFRLGQDNVYKQLNQIILDYVKTHNDKLAKNLKNYYKSVISMNSKAYSKKLAHEDIKTIDKLFAKNDPWELLAYFNRDEMITIHAPFTWSLNPDEKDSKVNRCYLSGHQFEMVDVNVYIDDGTDVSYKKKYREAFKKQIKAIFNVVLGKNNFNPQDVYDVEVEIFNAYNCTFINEDPNNTYNKVYADEALKKYGFDWKTFAQHLGFKTTPKFFITSSLNYLKCCTELFLKNWNTPKWKTFWLFILFKRLVRITKDWENIIYKFKGDFERGQEVINKSDAVSAALYMSIPFNTFLTNEYVKKYESRESVEYVKTLANDLKIVFKRILMRNTWLAPSTKSYALKKMDHFNFVFSKPETLREDPDLDYGPLLYENMQKIHKWRHEKLVTLDGKGIVDIPLMDWNQYPVKMIGSQAYVVNASYTPTQNSIYINLGYIQKPFVDLEERGIEYNLAHIGFTLGHELSHAFDDWGSQYGYDGNLHNWWTDADRAKYKLIQNDVIDQYEEFAARDGIDFDATIGIGEDLADISGLAICDEYLRDFQEKNKDLVPIRYFSYEAFYTYFAFQQKQIVKKKALMAQLKSNPHPLDKYRCNIPLSRSIIFRALYNVKKGDGMWWHNADTIW
jgi:putative endopeptidase